MLLAVITIVTTFFLMEFVAWSAHKYVMHGFLWSLHEDHHTKTNHHQLLEKNDSFFLIFATPSALFFIFGSVYWIPFLIYIGSGIALYGLAYFFVHDIFIHQRIKWLRRTKNPYLLAIRRAHKMHHKHLGKEDGECFGMLLVPIKYLRDARKASSNSLTKVQEEGTLN